MRKTIQNANGKQFHAVSLSGGKDSTAMLLLMIERDMPINSRARGRRRLPRRDLRPPFGGGYPHAQRIH